MDMNVEEITQYASLVTILFLLGYISIIFEEVIKFNKAATALLMGIGCWTILFLEPAESVERHLSIFIIQMFKVSQVLFFLMGALTIVEIINTHNGFQVITKHLAIPSKQLMLWVTGTVAFFLSSVLDNLTTTVVMISLIAKIVEDREERLLLGGLIVVAANLGGVWTPMGDVSTTLLWISGRISTLALLRDLFTPCFLALLAYTLCFSLRFRGTFATSTTKAELQTVAPGSTLILILGVCSLIFVPIFKQLTGLPPFMGMMFGLGLMWVVTDLLHHRHKERKHLRVTSILPKVDTSVILFYLGILLAINALESAGLLRSVAEWLNLHVHFPTLIPIFIGLISSVVDNVSLVAATIAMYDLQSYPQDSAFWQAIAYCAGTGGSILIIGSAAGIALMALEGVSFTWYLKKITIPAATAYFVGIFLYFLLSPFTQAFVN